MSHREGMGWEGHPGKSLRDLTEPEAAKKTGVGVAEGRAER